MAKRKPKYATKQIAIDANCKTMVSQMDDNEYVIAVIIPQPISSGSMLPMILNGDRRISM